MSKVRHLLGISGGKDSAALAVYMKTKYQTLDIDFYSCDTGKELDETYQLIKNLEVYLGIKINLLRGAENSSENSFDHFLSLYGGYLPSSTARWCTNKLKLEPFENYVGDDEVVSYVGIRGDEEREGYISTKRNIQSIFPFRQNIWSKDVTQLVLSNQNLDKTVEISRGVDLLDSKSRMSEVLTEKVNSNFTIEQKLKKLLEIDTKSFNKIVFDFLKTTDYTLSKEKNFPLIENDEILIKDDIFKILEESGVGVPAYYNKIEFEVDGKKGEYARSRSGCFFCFYQQKIEWIWLYEQHPELYKKAMEYEKDGYTWAQKESLKDLINPDRIKAIKEEYIKRMERNSNKNSPYLKDILSDSDTEGCASCFI